MLLKIIGKIQSPFVDKFGTPRQSQLAKKTISTIVLDKKIAPQEMLSGLDPHCYIWVVFGFHLNQQKKPIIKVHPPRLRGKKMGVLATRSPHRPNPLGLSLAKIVSIDQNTIAVSGLDLVNTTPVYDIKPYLTEFDRPREKSPLWIENNPFPQLKVIFAKNVFKNFSLKERNLLKPQLREILKEDPRPQAYLQKSDYIFWLKYGEHDVGFTVVDKTLTVVEIKSAKGS